jgi:dienelactone hydrolase
MGPGSGIVPGAVGRIARRISAGLRGALAVVLLGSGICAAPALAQQHRERIYPGAAPGSESWKLPETETSNARGVTVRNVRDPEILAYLPDPAGANGAAVIYAPGGALRMLAMGAEMQDVISRFNERGIAVIVLKYRTEQSPAGAPGQPTARPSAAAPAGGAPAGMLRRFEIRNANANPAPGDEQLSTVLRLATADAQEALRRVRSHATGWRIDPKRVGMIGSSAGGGVAIGALLAGAPGATPDFIISLYGPSLQDVIVPKDAPPLFLATEADHGPVTDGLVALYSMWKNAGKRAELHIYEVPNFSMPVSLWSDRAFAWMTEQKLLPPAVAAAQ